MGMARVPIDNDNDGVVGICFFSDLPVSGIDSSRSSCIASQTKDEKREMVVG